MSPIYSKMRDLEAYLGPLLAHSESWLLTSTTTSPVDPTEAVVARSLRCMAAIKLNSARIKVHRYCAFFDIPVFSRKHCDLKSLSSSPIDGAGDGGGDEPRRWPTCSCSTFANAFPGSGPGSATTPTTGSAGTTSTGLSPSSDGNASGVSYGPGPGGYGSGTLGATPGSTTTTMATTPGAAASSAPPSPPGNFPFTSHHSAKICLKSALAIAHSFDDLPFPNPTGAPPQPPGAPVFLGPASGIVCPRTMPSFACCAMQCAYALLMVHQKTKAMYPPYNPSAAEAMQAQGQAQQGQGQQQQRPVVVNSLVTRLQQGLNSIYATLANYATAFEALGGMRGESNPPRRIASNLVVKDLFVLTFAFFLFQIKSGARSRIRRRLLCEGYWSWGYWPRKVIIGLWGLLDGAHHNRDNLEARGSSGRFLCPHPAAGITLLKVSRW